MVFGGGGRGMALGGTDLIEIAAVSSTFADSVVWKYDPRLNSSMKRSKSSFSVVSDLLLIFFVWIKKCSVHERVRNRTSKVTL